jgi:hypothetical protein
MSEMKQPKHDNPEQSRRIIEVIRTILGFAFAPLAPALLLSVFPLAQGRYGEFKWSLTFAMAVGYPVMLLVGVPLFFLLRWRRWVSPWHYATAGIIVGAGLYLVVGPVEGMPLHSLAAWLLLSMLCTSIAAVGFWIVARPKPKP